MKALVCFSDGDDHPLSFLLKKGFRHCFCVLSVNDLWIEVNGADGVPFVRYITPDDGFDLAQLYRDKGNTVLEIETGERAPLSPFLLRNCVGLVKSFIGVKSYAVTPYQLYRFLEKRS